MKRGKKFAALWKRIIAYLIDAVLLSLIIVPPFTVNTVAKTNTSLSDLWSNAGSSLVGNVFLTSAIIALLMLLYWSVLEYKFGQSVGKIILRIGVTNTKKKNITFGQAVIRNIAKLSSILLVLDTLYMLIKKGNQRYSEVLSQTMVLEVKK